MSLTVTLVSSSTNCVDVRWSLKPSTYADIQLTLPGDVQQPQSSDFYLVNVAPSDNATGYHWTVVVRDSKTSALRLYLEHSGIVGTPLVNATKCCSVTRSVLGDEHWTVTSSAASEAGSDDCDQFGWLFRRLEVSPAPRTPLGDNFYTFFCNVHCIGCWLSLHFTVLLGGAFKLCFCCSFV